MSDKLCKSCPEVICIIAVNLHTDIKWISEQLDINPSSGIWKSDIGGCVLAKVGVFKWKNTTYYKMPISGWSL